jgi:fatty-acyl-CoA synthase
VLRDVFRPGDAWFRTGDLVRKDARGFYYFVDRVGETFRWKGENVSCAQVASSIAALDAVREAVVYGVRVPGADGRAGMAAIVAEGKLDLQALRAHLLERLPAHACPVFLRVRSEIEVTGTFKYNKVSLARQGFDPAETDDPIFFFHPEFQEYIGLDRVLYQRIQSGQVRI